MTTMSSFVDEMEKIAASSCATKGSKSRVGRRPIRVAKLLKKAQAPAKSAPWVMDTIGKTLPFLAANKKTLGTVGGTTLGVLGLQRGIEDIRMAEQLRAMQRR
jgi:hypothetical protein